MFATLRRERVSGWDVLRQWGRAVGAAEALTAAAGMKSSPETETFAVWRARNPMEGRNVCFTWAANRAPCHGSVSCKWGRQHEYSDEITQDQIDGFQEWLNEKPLEFK